jgi:hypothetical protein
MVRFDGPICLETDEQQEAVVALEMVQEQLSKVVADLYAWRWVLIALHNALQGFMVLALQRSNRLPVLKKEHAELWLEAYERGDPLPVNLRLDKFLNLYKKIKKSEMMEGMGGKAFRPTGTQGRSVKRLNSLRNEFIHFQPQGWLLQVEGYLPPIVTDCVAIIEFLAFESGNVVWNNPRLETRTRELIGEISERLEGAKSAYSSAAP